VAKAIAECAFVTSEMPVMLSLEMHCNCHQQNRLAKLMVTHMDAALLTYEELVTTQQATTLSPSDLAKRILVKGKVNKLKELEQHKRSSRLQRAMTERGKSLAARLTQRASRASSRISRTSRSGSMRPSCGEAAPSINRGSSSSAPLMSRVSSTSELSCCRPSSSSIADEMVGSSMKVRRKLDRRLKADKNKNKTDKYFSYYLTLRSEPVTNFLEQATPKSELPISSINEDRMLKELGVTVSERNLIEGLLSGAPRSDAGIGLTEEQQTSQAIVRLAANPTPEVNAMQRRTMTRMLRPYPLG